MGLVVENARVKIKNSKIQTQGPLLITHWGMSGPAILKASAFGARLLSEHEYQFEIEVNWIDETNMDLLFDQLQQFSQLNPHKGIGNTQSIYDSLTVFGFFYYQKLRYQLKRSGMRLEKRNLDN